MRVKIRHPYIQCGYTPLDFGLGLGLIGEDLDIGVWSIGLQFGFWWISLQFQALITKERQCLEKKESAATSLSI